MEQHGLRQDSQERSEIEQARALLSGSLVAGAAAWLGATRAATRLADNRRLTRE